MPSFIRGILKGSDHYADLGVEGGFSAVGLEEARGLGSCDCEQGLMSGCHEHGFEPQVVYREGHFLIICWIVRILIFSCIPSDP